MRKLYLITWERTQAVLWGDYRDIRQAQMVAEASYDGKDQVLKIEEIEDASIYFRKNPNYVMEIK